MANKRDYYEVLGVAKGAGSDEIKRAYRQAAMKYHPDRNKEPDAEARFKEASEAYEVLSDAEKRNRYDRFGHQGVAGQGVHDFSHMGVEDIFSIFGDIFGDAFGGGGRGGRRQRAERGIDIEAAIEIDLQEVATGAERSLHFERSDLCSPCGGKGAEPGSDVKTCRTCGGYGQVERQQNLGFLTTRTVVDCPTCRGRGKMIERPCRNCDGSGRSARDVSIAVKVPPGIHHGQRIRVRGEGEPGPSGAVRGDLHVAVGVRAHPFFERDGDHLICRLPISFTQATLGAQVDVPTLTGKTALRIPPGTQYGDVIRLAGQGLPDLRDGRRGDEIVQVVIEIPRKLKREQEELLREFAATEDKSVLPESKGFFDRVVEYFTGSPEGREVERGANHDGARTRRGRAGS